MVNDVELLAHQIAALYLNPDAAIDAMRDIHRAHPVYAFFVYFFLSMDLDITPRDMQILDDFALLWVNALPMPNNIDELLGGIDITVVNNSNVTEDSAVTGANIVDLDTTTLVAGLFKIVC